MSNSINEPKAQGSRASEELEGMVAEYYSKKLEEFGVSHRGVDWNSTESQELRFDQLLKVVDWNKPFLVNDLGCGYAAMYDYMKSLKATQNQEFQYLGYDLSDAMVAAATSLHADDKNCKFIQSSNLELADYTIASGIYNVRLEISDSEWLDYIDSSLESVNNASRLGFAFNMLTSYSDLDKRRDYLYYADPCKYFDLCKKRFSKNVAVLHDYGLYEFTIIVRKPASI
ncbi:MAG: class I SAM-dependent methyltransferase [Candidatus Obscuribacterales bacterium]|nr:class I SAM-dependent methyltransferase [Candidatus Obscuribacterales bacterium]